MNWKPVEVVDRRIAAELILKRFIIGICVACAVGNPLDAKQLHDVLAPPVNQSQSGSPPLHLSNRIMEDAKLVGLNGLSLKFRFSGKTDDEFSPQQIVRWGQWRGIIDRSAVWLSDGTWFAGDVAWSGQDQLTVQNRWFQLDNVPMRQVRGVVLLPAASLADWIRIHQSMQAATGEDDVVWLRDRRRLSGVVDWSSLSSNTQLKLVTSGQEIAVPIAEIEAMVASPALFGPVPSAALKIGLSDGSLLYANDISASDQRAQFKLSSLKQIETLGQLDEFAGAISFLSCERVPHVQYLDQLKPASDRHATENQLKYELGVGKDVNGGPLLLGSHRKTGMAFHGLAMHSSHQVAFRWDRSPGRFLAEVRLAPSANRLGSVLCKVLLARDGNLQTALEFPLDSITNGSRHVDIDIEDSQLVVLVVEKAEQSQYGDQVLWLDARIATPRN